MMNYEAILGHYLDGLSDSCNLVDEAIMSLEDTFQYRDGEALLHRSRPEAIAYLALKAIQKRGQKVIVGESGK